MTRAKTRIPEELPASEMALLLSITARRLQILAARGTLPKPGPGGYAVLPTAHGYFEHVAAAERARLGSQSADRLRDQRREAIARKMRREDQEIIAQDEALESFDEMAGNYLETMDGLAEKLATNRRGRRHAVAVVAKDRTRLVDEFALLRKRLETGANPEQEHAS